MTPRPVEDRVYRSSTEEAEGGGGGGVLVSVLPTTVTLVPQRWTGSGRPVTRTESTTQIVHRYGELRDGSAHRNEGPIAARDRSAPGYGPSLNPRFGFTMAGVGTQNWNTGRQVRRFRHRDGVERYGTEPGGSSVSMWIHMSQHQ